MKGDVMLGPSCQVERRVRVLRCFRRPRGLKANKMLIQRGGALGMDGHSDLSQTIGPKIT